jgi:competence protein ComEA
MRKAGILILASMVLPVVAYAATININTATAAQLDTLPGIGPTKAAAIVDYRTKNGAFTTIEDIQKVSGIGPVTFSNIKNSITVGTASTVTAATPPTQTAAQPPAPHASSNTGQPVEPITSTKKDLQTNDEAVNAPAVANELAAAGAALPPAVPAAVTTTSRASGLFSVWTLGLLGVIVVAGGAFILI